MKTEISTELPGNNKPCNACGAEGTVKFSGGPDVVTPNWWCKDCLNKAFPQYKHIFEHAETIVNEMEQNLKCDRVLH